MYSYLLVGTVGLNKMNKNGMCCTKDIYSCLNQSCHQAWNLVKLKCPCCML